MKTEIYEPYLEVSHFFILLRQFIYRTGTMKIGHCLSKPIRLAIVHNHAGLTGMKTSKWRCYDTGTLFRFTEISPPAMHANRFNCTTWRLILS